MLSSLQSIISLIYSQSGTLTETAAVPDWFYWGPRAVMEFDLRSGPTPVPDATWTEWQNAKDNEAFEGTLDRFVQHRFYAWIPQDVRESRNRPELPQFIYKQFALKWSGVSFNYYYYQRGEYYATEYGHVWGYTPVGYGTYQFANWPRTSPTLYDELPIYEV